MTKMERANGHTARPLRLNDLPRIIEIDRGYTNQRRNRFFEKRLEAANRNPDNFIQIGLDRDGTLVAFAFARVMQGEFGRQQAVAVLDIIGVAREKQERGYGHALLRDLCERMRERDVGTLQSRADWTNQGLLRFFNSNGFELASRHVLQRTTGEPLAEQNYEI